jgi:hypothetical protein
MNARRLHDGSNPVQGEVYSIQHYAIKFVSDLWNKLRNTGPMNARRLHDGLYVIMINISKVILMKTLVFSQCCALYISQRCNSCFWGKSNCRQVLFNFCSFDLDMVSSLPTWKIVNIRCRNYVVWRLHDGLYVIMINISKVILMKIINLIPI